MNVAIILAMLVQSGICAPVDFEGRDGNQLTVLVCPMMKQAGAAPDDTAPPPPPKDERAL